MQAMRAPVVAVAGLLLIVASTASSAPARLAHPPVEGAAGPYAKVRVVLTRRAVPGDPEVAPFTGTLTADGVTMALAGPDEPDDLFLFQPRAVMFVPIDRSRSNGVVILYDSSRIGPQHGTDHRALVYRIMRERAVRVRAVEDALDGAASAAAVRARLKRR